MRREKCACRGFIEADGEADIERAVRDHNAEPLHSEWLAWNDESLPPVRVARAPSMLSYARQRRPWQPSLRRVA